MTFKVRFQAYFHTIYTHNPSKSLFIVSICSAKGSFGSVVPMIGSMNEKRGKCLALTAVLAMAVCALAVAMPSESDAANIAYFSGDFDADQSIESGVVAEINGNMNIKNGATFTVKAGAILTIDSDVKVTVDGQKVPAGTEPKYAEFVVQDGARIIINGQLIIGQEGKANLAASFSGANAEVRDGSTFYDGVFVHGSVLAQKGGKLIISAEVMKGGSVAVSSNGKQVSAIGGALYLMDGASADIKGDLMQFNAVGADKKTETVIGLNVIATGADFSKAAAKNTDCLSATMKISAEKPCAQDSATNVSQLKFAASVGSNTVYKDVGGKMAKTAVLVSGLDVSGSVKNAKLTVSDAASATYKDRAANGKDVSLSSANTVSGELIVSKTGSMTVAADLGVSGKVSVLEADKNKDGTAVKTLAFESGKVTVSGTLEAVDSSIGTDKKEAALIIDGGSFAVTKKAANPIDSIAEIFKNFKGAFYNSETAAVNMLVACELSAALEAIDGAAVSGATVAGLSVEEADAAKKDAAMKAAGYVVAESFALPAGATLTVLNGLVVGKNIVVTIAADSDIDLAGGKVFVDGKLIDSNGADSRASSIISDVIVKDRENGIYTYTSLKIAISEQERGTIEIQNDAVVSEDMTIPAGVTVDLGTHTLAVSGGKTLIVDGVIDASEGSIDDSAGKAGIVVNNYMIIKGDATGLAAVGVYADGKVGEDSGCFVMSLDVYAMNIITLTDATVKGDLEYSGSISFAASADQSALSLAVEAGSSLKITGIVSLSYFAIDVSAVSGSDTATISATVNNAAGAVKLVDVTGIIISDAVDDEGVAALQISGKPSGTKAFVSIVSGVLTAIDGFDASELSSFAVAQSTELALSGTVKMKSLSVAGKMTVPKDAVLDAVALEIQGRVVVEGGGKITAENVYVGTTAKALKALKAPSVGASASLSGKGEIAAGLLYVAAGASVDRALVEALESVIFQVQGAEVMTVYGQAGKTVGVFTPTVKNANFLNWYDSQDSKEEPVYEVTLSASEGKAVRLIAKIDSKIYSVTVIGDEGVGTVAVDGHVLKKVNNVFSIDKLEAGSHTISVGHKYGYEGTLVIKVNGTAISGSTFTLSGTSDEDTDVSISISGSEPASAEPAVQESKDRGVGITECLLVVLVAMVLVMSAMVALHMRRS